MKKLNEVARKYAVARSMSDTAKMKEPNLKELEEAVTKKKRSKKLEMEDEEGLEIEIEKE